VDSSSLSIAGLHTVNSKITEPHQINSSHFSLNAMTTIRSNFIQDVFACKEAGISSIGLCRNKLENFGVEKGIELIKDEQLEVSSLSWAGGFTGTHGMTFVEAVEDGLEAINLAHALGSKTLIVVGGALGTHIESHATKTVVNGLNWLAEFAAEKNVTLALLPMYESFQKKWTFINSVNQCIDIIDTCNHSNVKMAFNTYHMGCEKNILSIIGSIIDYIQIVQIADCKTVPTLENDRCLPGEGILPVSRMMKELIENGYQDYFEFDIWSKELWRSNYSELVSHCQSGFMDLITVKEQETSRVYS
jgi:sugar phosphate isomerase/epimerase